MPDFQPTNKTSGYVHTKPPAPPVLSLISTGAGSATLGVSSNQYGVAFYYGTTSGGENLLQIAGVATAGQLTITLVGLPAGTLFFVCRALGGQNQGYGPLSNEVTNSGLAKPIYYGFVPSLTPAAGDITAMASQIKISFPGTYVLTQTGATQNYPCIAIPASFGTPSVVTINGQSYTLSAFSVTVGGVAYVAYINPYATFSTSLTMTVS